MKLSILPHLWIDESELELTFIRSPGPGGQNVNKVATAVLLRFNVMQSPSLPEEVKLRLVAVLSSKMTQQGDIMIKATRHRTQERNKQDAMSRLLDMLRMAATPKKKRRKTKPTKGSVERRLSKKKLHGKSKSLRQKKPSGFTE